MAEPPADDVLVFAQDIARTYLRGGRKVEALCATTCTVRRNARIAIMGSSGSGKSTLLHLFAGLDLPTAGEIRWPALGSRDQLRPGHVAVAFQSPSLIPFLSVAENVGLPLFLLGKAALARREAITELERFGLAGLADKLPDQISGGQAQRVSLARATASRPRLLLADEPTGQLDHATGREAMAALKNWAQVTGSGVIVATHDAAVAQGLDEIWYMDHGRLSCPQGAPLA